MLLMVRYQRLESEENPNSLYWTHWMVSAENQGYFAVTIDQLLHICLGQNVQW